MQSRRNFLSTTFAAAAGMGLAGRPAFGRPKAAGKLALLGGDPVRREPFPSWPKVAENDQKNWGDVLQQKEWCRLGVKPSFATQFEETWRNMTGAKYSLA